jgi:2-methylcitrate dehydratase PrpD
MPDRDLAFDLAEHAARTPLSAIPEAALKHATYDLIDSLGVCLGGLHAPGVPETRAEVAASVRPGAAAVFGTGDRWPAAFAAIANATAGHALDYDDTLDEGGGMHAGVPVHSSALAIADEIGAVSGLEYLGAVVLGLDVAVRLALAPTDDYGWHRTSAFGVFGVAVAAGRLLGLDPEQMRNALGIAFSQASGNRQCIADGALSKRLQAGFAARDGVTAVRLAQRGLTGAFNIFEGANGFFPLYQRGGYDRDSILAGLGREFRSVRISTKPYPCGRNLHTMLDAALELHGRANGREVERVMVELDERALATASTDYPASVVEAQFNRRYTTAVALTEGGLTIAAVDRPDAAPTAVRALFDRVELAARECGANGAVRIAVRYTDGTTDVAEATVARGHPTKPLTLDQITAKFHDCNRSAGLPLSQETADAVIDAALRLRTEATPAALTGLLAGSGVAASV